jgi:hypothetical protein
VEGSSVALLAGSNIGDVGAEELAGALPQMASLTTLDLSGTACLLRFELCVRLHSAG